MGESADAIHLIQLPVVLEIEVRRVGDAEGSAAACEELLTVGGEPKIAADWVIAVVFGVAVAD
jgi:hypothetical protein